MRCPNGTVALESKTSDLGTPRRSIEIDSIIFVKRDDGLFPVPHSADAETMASGLPSTVLGPDIFDLDVEEGLDRVLDFRLGRERIDLEGIGVPSLREIGRLLGDERADDDLIGFEGRSGSRVLGWSA
jgi:hypothetical protein